MSTPVVLTHSKALSYNQFTTASVDFTNADGYYYLLVIGGNAAGTKRLVPSSVTGCGLTWSCLDYAEGYNTYSTWVDVWAGSGSPTSGAISVTFSGSYAGVAWSVLELRAGGIVQTESVTIGSGTTGWGWSYPADPDDASWLLAAIVHDADEATTPRTNWTELSDEYGGVRAVETQYRGPSSETQFGASWATTCLSAGIGLEFSPYVVNLSAAFQGVATFGGSLRAARALDATLQGSASLSAELAGSFPPDYSRYDAYVEDDDGHFGVIYYEGEGARKITSSKALTPVRQDVGQNPFEIRPESGDLFSQGDFSGGQGQRYYHHKGSDQKKFLRSEGFDITEPGRLFHLHDTAVAYSTSSIGKSATIAGYRYIVDGTTLRKCNGAFPGSWSTDDCGNESGAIYDIESSGSIGYVALDSHGIHKLDGSWSHYNNVAVKRLLWAKGRLMAASDTDIYEVVGPSTPTTIETLPSGWAFESMFEAGPYIYACAVNTTDKRSELHIYGLNSGATAIEKKGDQQMPNGQLIMAGCGYMNVILLGGGKVNASGGLDPVLYRAVMDETTALGYLEYIKLAEEEGSGTSDLSVRHFLRIGESIFYGWATGAGSIMGARSGLGVYNIGTGAVATHLKATGTAKQVPSILTYKGRLCFSVADTGFYYEDVTKYVATATLITSVADWNNAGGKRWHELSVSHAPLPSTASVKMYYATELPDASTTWSEGLLSAVTASQGKDAFVSGGATRLFVVKMVSSASDDQAAAPEIASYGVRSYPYPAELEYELVRYIRLQDVDQKDVYAEEIRQDASEIYARVLGLCYSFVTLYEPGLTWRARVDAVSSPELILPPFDPHIEQSGDLYVVQLSLTATL